MHAEQDTAVQTDDQLATANGFSADAALDDDRQPPNAQPTPVVVVVDVGERGRLLRAGRAGAGTAAGQGGREY